MQSSMDGSKMLNEFKIGDAVELISKISSESVDLIIADPPYNLGKNYGSSNDNLEKKAYLEFSLNWLSEAHRVLKSTGTIYVFMGFRYISYLYAMMEDDLKLQFNSWICWNYTQGMGKTKGFSPRHDDILMFNKSKDFVFNLDDIRVPQKFYRSRNNMRGANPGDVWEFSHIHYCQSNRQAHPTQKPEALIERMVLASSNPNDLVLDPFAGSGTTNRVCQNIRRNCIGFELHPEYVEMAKERLAMPFEGFDGIDPKMERVPRDLNEPNIRDKYISDHIKWFLRNHPAAIERFVKEVDSMYGRDAANVARLASGNKEITQKIDRNPPVETDLFSLS